MNTVNNSSFSQLTLELADRLAKARKAVSPSEVSLLINQGDAVPDSSLAESVLANSHALSAREVFSRACVYFNIHNEPKFTENDSLKFLFSGAAAAYDCSKNEIHTVTGQGSLHKIFNKQFIGLNPDELNKLLVSHEIVHSAQCQRFKFLTKGEADDALEELIKEKNPGEWIKLLYEFSSIAPLSVLNESRSEEVSEEQIKAGKTEFKKGVEASADNFILKRIADLYGYASTPYEIEARKESALFSMKLCLEEIDNLVKENPGNKKRIEELIKAISTLQNEIYLNDLLKEVSDSSKDSGKELKKSETKLRREAFKTSSYTASILRGAFRQKSLLSIVKTIWSYFE